MKHKKTLSGRFSAWAKGLLASATIFFGGAKSSAEAPQAETNSTPIVAQTDAKQLGRDLYTLAEPLLILNEGKRLTLYRCNAKKATIAIGCDLQDFPTLAKDLNVTFFKTTGKQTQRLTPMQRDILLANLPNLSKSELSRYSITEEDALRLSKETYAYFYDRLIQKFAKPNYAYVSRNGVTEKTDTLLAGVDIKEVPTLLQMAIMDTLYQLGETKFEKYHLFETALREGKYETAFHELAVNCTNAPLKKYKDNGSARRGYRKDFLAAAYRLQQSYLANPQAMEGPAEDFVFELVQRARVLAGGGRYHSLINEVERKAAFETIVPVIMDMYYPKATKEYRDTRSAELLNFWTEAEAIYKRYSQQNTPSQKKTASRPAKKKAAPRRLRKKLAAKQRPTKTMRSTGRRA